MKCTRIIEGRVLCISILLFTVFAARSPGAEAATLALNCHNGNSGITGAPLPTNYCLSEWAPGGGLSFNSVVMRTVIKAGPLWLDYAMTFRIFTTVGTIQHTHACSAQSGIYVIDSTVRGYIFNGNTLVTLDDAGSGYVPKTQTLCGGGI